MAVVFTMTDDTFDPIPLIDDSVLGELREVLGDELDDIVEQFVTQVDEQVETVCRALDAGQWVTTVEAAHSLKGGAGNFGASRLSAIAGVIERAGRDADLPLALSQREALLETKGKTVSRLVELGYLKSG